MLLGIFMFPLVFQSIHITELHSNHLENHSECRVSENQTKQDCRSVDIFSIQEDDCPVCEYKISVKSFQEVVEIAFVQEKHNTVYSNFYQETVKSNLKSSTSQRGPPKTL